MARARWDWEAHASRANALKARAQELFEAYKRTGKRAGAQAAWQQACEALNAAVEAVPPPGFWDAARALHAGAPADLDLLIEFLEVGPVFFRSGYLADGILQRLKRLALDGAQKQRLRAVVLDAVARRGGRHFRRYCALARAVDGEGFRQALEALRGSRDGAVRQRARWVLEALAQRDHERAATRLPRGPTRAK